MKRLANGILSAAAMVVLAGAKCGPAKLEAEYAVRWDPAEGGPRTPTEVARLLGLHDAVETSFDVRYYDAPAVASAPDSARTIMRERVRQGGAPELIVKYRRGTPITGALTCPLEPEATPSAQVDVGFGADDSVIRVYSYTCELSGESFPPALHAVPRPCTIEVTRASAEGVKIESWSLAGGGALLEVSRVGRDSDKELGKFRRVVEKLTAAGVRPTMRSKTDIAGACG